MFAAKFKFLFSRNETPDDNSPLWLRCQFRVVTPECRIAEYQSQLEYDRFMDMLVTGLRDDWSMSTVRYLAHRVATTRDNLKILHFFCSEVVPSVARSLRLAQNATHLDKQHLVPIATFCFVVTQPTFRTYFVGSRKIAEWLRSRFAKQICAEGCTLVNRCIVRAESLPRGPLTDEEMWSVVDEHRDDLSTEPSGATGRAWGKGGLSQQSFDACLESL